MSLALQALKAQEAIARAFVAILFTWGDHESVEDTVTPKSFNSLTGRSCLPLDSVNKQFTYEWQLKYQGIWAMAVDNVLKFVLVESHVILSCSLNYRVQILCLRILVSSAKNLIEEKQILEKQIFYFLIFYSNTKQTKIPIKIPYTHSINIYKHNNIILELTLLPCAQTKNFLEIVCKMPLLERALGLKANKS